MGKPDVTTINNKWWELQYKICIGMARTCREIAALCTSSPDQRSHDPNLDGRPEAHAQDYKNALDWMDVALWWLTQAEEAKQKIQPPEG
jgi:hypothetical protein